MSPRPSVELEYVSRTPAIPFSVFPGPYYLRRIIFFAFAVLPAFNV